jgi:hypothetical protein
MGSAIQKQWYPQKCYDPHNYWILGWHEEKSRVVSPSDTTLYKVAAFVDMEKAYHDEYVLLNIHDEDENVDFYLQYNRAKSFNAETGELGDTIVLVEEQEQGTNLLAGLGPHQRFIKTVGTKTLIIEACRAIPGSINTPDIMHVSIGYDKSLCPTLQPSGRPTLAPTLQPTREPTPFPTLQTVPEPARQPVSDSDHNSNVSLQPTPPPTPRPTLRPTVSPTVPREGFPTTLPTFINPTRKPTSFPTIAIPTAFPTIAIPTKPPKPTLDHFGDPTPTQSHPSATSSATTDSEEEVDKAFFLILVIVPAIVVLCCLIGCCFLYRRAMHATRRKPGFSKLEDDYSLSTVLTNNASIVEGDVYLDDGVEDDLEENSVLDWSCEPVISLAFEKHESSESVDYGCKPFDPWFDDNSLLHKCQDQSCAQVKQCSDEPTRKEIRHDIVEYIRITGVGRTVQL